MPAKKALAGRADLGQATTIHNSSARSKHQSIIVIVGCGK